mmetsp:Transcript_108841/g.306721  ORF Transcript_108841/g.306721 Transcript_108841/m.306721 type:complete len:227 (-) Transcript_108841:232-912(-)
MDARTSGSLAGNDMPSSKGRDAIDGPATCHRPSGPSVTETARLCNASLRMYLVSTVLKPPEDRTMTTPPPDEGLVAVAAGADGFSAAPGSLLPPSPEPSFSPAPGLPPTSEVPSAAGFSPPSLLGLSLAPLFGFTPLASPAGAAAASAPAGALAVGASLPRVFATCPVPVLAISGRFLRVNTSVSYNLTTKSPSALKKQYEWRSALSSGDILRLPLPLPPPPSRRA